MNLKEIRKKQNLTQTELAKKINTAPTTVSRYENKKIEPTVSIAIKLAKVFNTTVEELFSNGGEEKLKQDAKTLKKKLVERTILFLIGYTLGYFLAI